ncbi:hypothetical protein Clacol_005798 [Clathrus columnatus]|uniref:Afadin and alpha-actinin-binding-domain-containing protein n=1 Tax=Clathrus columnatus TaxID=1419009 RepID=A0AAV5AAC9_9AGAM|nr:hypothetical protein Clacol_005798 [Clathrus columnatus]
MAGPLRSGILEELNSTLPGISLSLNPSEDYEPSSTLQYVNAQLVAHGFARSPGISIDGISNEDGQKLVKCIMAMLSQRVEDLSRTEELGTKLRTLTYEYERSQSINRSAQEKAANAEREMTSFQSKLAASQRLYTAEVAAHKQTTSELQRTRTSMQYLRTTTQNELKRKEKDIERVLDRWTRVCDSQVKLGTVGIGLNCSNYAEACELFVGQGILEEALEQAEEARLELTKENEGFRSVLLGTANALQTMIYKTRTADQDTHVPEPSQLTPTAVFAPPTSCLTHPENAHLKIKELFSSLKEAVANTRRDASSIIKSPVSDEEVTMLRETINSLRSELDKARQISKQSEAQKVFDQHTKHAAERSRLSRGLVQPQVSNLSTDLITHTEQDELRKALDQRAEELEAERKKYTEATIKFGHEKSKLEAERRNFLEEKRRWAVDQMLAELPPTPPVQDPDLIPSPERQVKTKPAFPNHSRVTKIVAKSPKRAGVSLKSPSKKKTKIIFKEDRADTNQRTKMRSGKSFERVEVLYEPETNKQAKPESTITVDTSNLPPIKDFPPALQSQIRQNSLKDSKPSMPLVLPTTFSLPPPSPASSLSLQPLVVSSSSSLEPLFNHIPNSSTPVPSAQTTSTSSPSAFDNIPLIPSSSTLIPLIPSKRIRTFPSPRTPRALLNAGANGMMKHAYSPAKPSPLSRILMIADSPPSPGDDIGVIMEKDEAEVEPSKLVVPTRTDVSNTNDEASPLRERIEVKNAVAKLAKKSTLQDEKGKGKSKARTVTMEKENVEVVLKKTKPSVTDVPKKNTKTVSAMDDAPVMKHKSTKSSKLETQSQAQMVKPGGARRIPLGAPGAGKVNSRLI